ncbi:glycosyltransferase [Agarivorans aestuarii]|uniref:glycosyltransferase n=1 Tax=Agarivorans aestuarii TaxID=1563703 RepID=UPI001C8090A4|nr:glycosyltransferase [Agarivorans aestuarii]
MTPLLKSPVSGCDILIFSSSFHQGGAERLAVTLANLLVSNWSVEFLSLNGQGPFRQELDDSLTCSIVEQSSSLKAIPKLVKQLKRIKPKVVFCSQSHLAFSMLLAIRLSGLPCKLVAREASCPSINLLGISSLLKRTWVKKSAKYAYRRADYLVAPAKYVAADVSNYFDLDRTIQVLANPLDKDMVNEQALAPCEHPWVTDEQPFVLAVGRLVPEKDYETLIKAIALCQKQQVTRLIILGEGLLREKLTALVQDLELSEVVSLTGFASNPFCYMKHCQSFVLSSLVEGMPNALVQAQFLGAPCISSDCPGGASELLPEQNYFPVGDPKALAKLILNPPSNSQSQLIDTQGFVPFFESIL